MIQERQPAGASLNGWPSGEGLGEVPSPSVRQAVEQLLWVFNLPADFSAGKIR